MGKFRLVCFAAVVVTGCHRDLTVHPCAHDRSLCPDSAVADAPTDTASDDAINETPSDACECTPGEIVEVDGEACPGALEKRQKACESTCSWGDEACAFRKGWTKIADAPAEFAGRLFVPTVWTGGELVVFGGSNYPEVGEGRADGAIYSLQRNVWTLLPATTAAGRRNHSAVWTGREVIVFGGSPAFGAALADGVAYDALAKTWRTLSTSPLSGRSRHGAVYAPTLRQMFVWGGATATGNANDGAAYDTETDTWTPLPAAPISARFEPFLGWTGTEVFVWGGRDGTGALNDGAAYNPSTRIWRSVPSAPLAGRLNPKVALTASEFLFFGGDGDPLPFDGARYNAATSIWSAVPTPSSSVLSPRGTMQSWSDGPRLFVWSGADFNADPAKLFAGGAVFDSSSSSWSPLVDKNAPTPRHRALSLWTGKKAALMWGGVGSPGGGALEALADGAIYVP